MPEEPRNKNGPLWEPERRGPEEDRTNPPPSEADTVKDYRTAEAETESLKDPPVHAGKEHPEEDVREPKADPSLSEADTVRIHPAGEGSGTPDEPEDLPSSDESEVGGPGAPPLGAVVLDPEPGVYPSSVTVRLSCPTQGAGVRYTLDGTEPDESSPLHDPEEGLLLRRSATLKARAHKQGHEPGDLVEATYEVRAPLWRENEPKDRADAVPHAEMRGTRVGRWRLAGASVRGKLHAHRASWREDAFAFGAAGGWTTFAVSDGAGSAPLSRVGARLACDAAVGHLEGALTRFALVSKSEEGLMRDELPRLREFLAGAAEAALGAIRAEAAARERPPADFAATLLVAVCRPWRGRHLVSAIQVGDGTVALLDWDGGVTLLGVPDHGEHSSETRFLTTAGVEPTFPNRVVFSVKDRLRCVTAMSDGVSDDFFPEEKRILDLLLGENLSGMTCRDGRPITGVMGAVSGEAAPAPALLEWLRYEKRGSSDDRTLVLFWDEA